MSPVTPPPPMPKDNLAKKVAELTKQVQDVTAAKNQAYSERNQLVAAFARMAKAFGYPVGIAADTSTDFDPEWRPIVYVDLPTGQVSWHFHRSEVPLFAEFGGYNGAWDGHTTPEKYNRLKAFAPSRLLELKASALIERIRAVMQDWHGGT